MNPILLKFDDGTVFLVATAIVTVGVLLLVANRLPRPVRFSVAVIVRLAMVTAFLSATPLPTVIYAAWFALVVASVVFCQSSRCSAIWPKASLTLPVLVALVSAGLGISELLYRRAPTITISANHPIVVVGDSLSAGIGGKERPWPMLLGELYGIPVVDMARAGATVELAQAPSNRANECPCRRDRGNRRQ